MATKKADQVDKNIDSFYYLCEVHVDPALPDTDVIAFGGSHLSLKQDKDEDVQWDPVAQDVVIVSHSVTQVKGNDPTDMADEYDELKKSFLSLVRLAHAAGSEVKGHIIVREYYGTKRFVRLTTDGKAVKAELARLAWDGHSMPFPAGDGLA